MENRKFWQKSIEQAWTRRSLIWLTGVRRAGKTHLCKSLPKIEYFDCELPRTRQRIEADPELFLEGLAGKRIVLDEIHRLKNPSELLKIGTDHYPSVHMIATGSSMLGASSKFRDTLAGRKITIHLTPVISQDMLDFHQEDLKKRLHVGGMPAVFLGQKIDDYFFQEWLDAYWAKDIQELFRLERRQAFQKLLELLILQSGQIFEATRLARDCEINRQTVINYMSVLESTLIIKIIRPFNQRKSQEIISAPKVFAFDTGFISFLKKWDTPRAEDYGYLWEHFVLNEFTAFFPDLKITYWRDKQGHEIDFVIEAPKGVLIAIECKWSQKNLDTKNIQVFLKHYPHAVIWAITRETPNIPKVRIGENFLEWKSLEQSVAALKNLLKRI